MKWLSIFLALNLLVATNGIALYDHFCPDKEFANSKTCCKDSPETDCAANNQEENCCYNIYIDFLKQDIDAYHSSSLEADELLSMITLNSLFFTIVCFNLPENGEDSYTVEPPPLIESKASNDRSLLQVFRC